MKPAPFEYYRAYSVREAVSLLGECGDGAKVIAGGQSLVPMMNFRLARPTALVDINPIRGLDRVTRDDRELRVGALTTHRSLELNRDPAVLGGFALIPQAARWIGHYPIRCHGTIGGSIAHADPTAEWCILASLYDASVTVVGPAGQRRVAASDWFTGFLTTTCRADEVVQEISFSRPRTHGALTEFARRRGDFAVVASAVVFDVVDATMRNVAIALGGVASLPIRAREAEAFLEGSEATSSNWLEAGRIAASGLVAPTSDANGDGNYRRQLASALTARAFTQAADTAAAL